MATHMAHAPTFHGRLAELVVDLRVWWRAFGGRVLWTVTGLAVVAGVVAVDQILVAHQVVGAHMLVFMGVSLVASVIAALAWEGRP